MNYTRELSRAMCKEAQEKRIRNLGSFKTGGLVKKTGWYKLEKGEFVLTRKEHRSHKCVEQNAKRKKAQANNAAANTSIQRKHAS